MKPNNLEQKQQFLRSQIIDSGIDPESFMVFMGTVKGEGENINLQVWTLGQLKKVVKQFKQNLLQQLKRQENHQSKLTGPQAYEINRHSMIIADRVMGSKLSKREKVFYDRDDLWDYEMVSKIDCRKTQKFFNFQAYPEIACKGVQVKKVGGFLGFGGTNIIELTLTPNFSSSSLVRKSQDFDWLRQILLSQYPGSYVPPLAETPVFEPEDKASISKRAKQIMQFVNNLLQYEHLLNNKYAHVFLTESDTRAFQNFKYKNANVEATKTIPAFQNLEGFFPLQISQRVQQFTKNSSKFSKEVGGLLSSIDENFTKLQENLLSVCKHSGNLARDFGKLREKHVVLYEKCNFDKISQNTQLDKKLAAIFAHLKSVFLSLQTHSKKQASFLQEISQEKLKGMIKEWNEFDAVEKKHKRELDAYLTFKLSLSKRKQQFFLDISKKQMEERERTGQTKETTLAEKQEMYKLKFPNDSKLEQQRRSWQGYINHMLEKSFFSILWAHEKQLERKLSKVYPALASMLDERAGKYKYFGKYLEEEGGKIGYEHESKPDKK